MPPRRMTSGFELYEEECNGQIRDHRCNAVAGAGVRRVLRSGAVRAMGPHRRGHGPGRAGQFAYALLGLLFALGGAGVAARHVWLQHLPPDKVPACGPDLFFMLENLPLGRTLQKLFEGSGQCAEVKWRFLGMSIPEWSLVCFGALAIYAAWIMLRAPRRTDA